MYWAWKNIKKLYPNLEYIGLNHYRRYFSFDKKNWLYDQVRKPSCELKNYKLNVKKVFSVLEKGFAIVAKLEILPFTVWVQYCTMLIVADIRILRKVVHDVSPDYDEVFYQAIIRGISFSPFNMTIMKWEDFDAYCSWLFKVLAEVEKRIDMSKYRGDQKRTFGYMAERLFNVWILKNHIKTKKFNVYRYADDCKQQSLIRRCFYLLRCFISSRAYRPIHKHIQDWTWLEKEE